jgi:hypothetical protein
VRGITRHKRLRDSVNQAHLLRYESYPRETRVTYVSSRTRGYDGDAGNISVSEDLTESEVDALTPRVDQPGATYSYVGCSVPHACMARMQVQVSLSDHRTVCCLYTSSIGCIAIYY